MPLGSRGHTMFLYCSVAMAQVVLLMFCGENSCRCLHAKVDSASRQRTSGLSPSVAYAHVKLACAHHFSFVGFVKIFRSS